MQKGPAFGNICSMTFDEAFEWLMKAKLLQSDATRVEFTLDFDLPPRKYLIAVQTRCGRGKDYKTAICRHEVSVV